jgi:CYTH domain-containing protein
MGGVPKRFIERRCVWPLEIERKFLVRGMNWRTWAGVSMRQGYLNPDKARTVRVRQAGERGFRRSRG